MFFQIGLQTNLSWPVKDTEVRWRDRTIILRPATSLYAPDVLLEFDQTELSNEAAHKFLREFLSAWVWIERQRAREYISGGNKVPLRVGPGPQFQSIADPFQLPSLPEPHDDKSLLALALHREALNATCQPHMFLSFWKILSTKNPDGAKGPQRDWLLQTFSRLGDSEGRNRLEELQASGKSDNEIAHQLYVCGRCAVAHAYSEPIVNPDDPKHEAELTKEMPLVRALAEYVIELEYGLAKPQRASNQPHQVRMFCLPFLDEEQQACDAQDDEMKVK